MIRKEKKKENTTESWSKVHGPDKHALTVSSIPLIYSPHAYYLKKSLLFLVLL